MLLGSPALHHAGGIADWVEDQTGEMSARVARSGHRHRCLRHCQRFPGCVRHRECTRRFAQGRGRGVFRGTGHLQPYEIDGRYYVDGGVVSGTHADLLLGNAEPLDLVLVLAPMAAEEAQRRGSFL